MPPKVPLSKAPYVSAAPAPSPWVPSVPVPPAPSAGLIYTDPYIAMTQHQQQLMARNAEATTGPSSWPLPMPHMMPGGRHHFPAPQMVMGNAVTSGDARWPSDSCYMGFPAPGQWMLPPRPKASSRSSSPVMEPPHPVAGAIAM